MKRILIAAILSASLQISAPRGHAAFEDPYWTARVAALSGAFAALSDDASGVFYNAAAGAMQRKRQANFTYAKLFAGLNEVRFALSQFSIHQPIGKYTSIGAGWGGFTSTFYRELTVALGAARNLKPVLGEYDGELSAGISLRYLSRSFDLDARSSGDPVFRGGSRSGNVAVDLHLYSVPEPNRLPGLSAGLSFKSVNQPNIGFGETERLPSEIVGGLAYRWDRFKFPFDVSARKSEIRTHFGAEVSLWEDRVALRAGFDRSQLSSGFGYEQPLSSAFSLLLDYAFLWPLELKETSGSHRATLSIKF